MANGVVKWFNETKGYGFITPTEESLRDVFVHISQIEKAGLGRINTGERLSFETYDDRGRIAAGNLKRLDDKKK